jgi:hypothetical protein
MATKEELKRQTDELLGKKPAALTSKELRQLITDASTEGEVGKMGRKLTRADAKAKLKELVKSGVVIEGDEGYELAKVKEARTRAAAEEAPAPKAAPAPEAPKLRPQDLSVNSVTANQVDELVTMANRGDTEAKKFLMDLRDFEGAPVKVAQAGTAGTWERVRAVPAVEQGPPTPAPAPAPVEKLEMPKPPERKVQPRMGATWSKEFKERAAAQGVDADKLLKMGKGDVKQLSDLPDTPELRAYADKWLTAEAEKSTAKQTVRMREAAAKAPLGPKTSQKKGFAAAERKAGLDDEALFRRKFDAKERFGKDFKDDLGRGGVVASGIDKKKHAEVVQAFEALQARKGGYPKTPLAMDLEQLMGDETLSPQQRFAKMVNMHGKLFYRSQIRKGVVAIDRTKEAVRESIKQERIAAAGPTMGSKYQAGEVKRRGQAMFRELRKYYPGANTNQKIQKQLYELGIQKDFRNARTQAATFAMLQESEVEKLREFILRKREEVEKAAGGPLGKKAAAAADDVPIDTEAAPEGGSFRNVEPDAPRMTTPEEAEFSARMSSDDLPLETADDAAAAATRTAARAPVGTTAGGAAAGAAEAATVAATVGAGTGTTAGAGPAPTAAGTAPTGRARRTVAERAARRNQLLEAIRRGRGGTGATARAVGGKALGFLGPLFAVLSAYQLAEMARANTVGAADEKRMRVLEALGGVSGGLGQDQAMRQMLAQQRSMVELAGIQRQKDLDQMNRQYIEDRALNSAVGANRDLLAAIAMPSQPSMMEMMARI